MDNNCNYEVFAGVFSETLYAIFAESDSVDVSDILE